ncbi:MAG: plasmid replication initiator TrfA [Methylophilus sp.]|uniref:plasmid replication initiator TrfA n=1 Tax=Methylophilus sp. TaxID=29541 RepID=UPI003FA0FB43
MSLEQNVIDALEPMQSDLTEFELTNVETSSRKPAPVSLSLFLNDLKNGVTPKLSPAVKKSAGDKPARVKIDIKSDIPITQQMEFFPLHANFQRVSANALSRSSLFTINARPAKDQPREVISKRTQIFSLKGCSIYFSGELLDQYDLDVFMAIILCYGDKYKYNETIRTTPLQLLKHAGWNSSKKDYVRLMETLNRMVEANIEVEYVRTEYLRDANGKKLALDPIEHKVKVKGHLISTYKLSEIGERGNGHKKELELKIDEEIIKLFKPGTYSSLNWDKHLDLSQMAKFLNHFYATHTKPFPYGVEIFMKLTGSRSKSTSSFKQALNKALQELVDAQILKFYNIINNQVHVIKV